jgi:hypothetical protein
MKSGGFKEFLGDAKAFASDVLMAPFEVGPRAWRAGREGFGDPKLADVGGLSAALAPAIPALVLGAKIALVSPIAGAAVAMIGAAASYAAAGFLPSKLPKSLVGDKPFEQITMRRTTARMAEKKALGQQTEPSASPDQSADIRNAAGSPQGAQPGVDQEKRPQSYASIRPEFGAPTSGAATPGEAVPVVASAPVEPAGVSQKAAVTTARAARRNFGAQSPG